MTSVTCSGEPSELELDPDDDDGFLEIGRYVAKKSIADVKTGPGLNETERAEFLDLAQEFSSLFTERSRNHEPCSALHQPHVE